MKPLPALDTPGPLEGDVTVEADSSRGRVLVLACGAIAREVLAVIRLNEWDQVELRCLPGKLHNTPPTIARRVDEILREVAHQYERVFVAYADCGTGGVLDRVLEAHGVERLPGAHCYQFFAGQDAWLGMHEAEPRTFYLTDFLCRHFERLVVHGLGLHEHPELLHAYFGNYVRLVFLAQTEDPGLAEDAQRAAAYLGLELEVRRTGLGDLQPALERFAGSTAQGPDGE